MKRLVTGWDGFQDIEVRSCRWGCDRTFFLKSTQSCGHGPPSSPWQNSSGMDLPLTKSARRLFCHGLLEWQIHFV